MFGGTYAKTGLLVVIPLLGAAFGWLQVEIVQVRGSDVALQPAWTWLVAFGTLILGIVRDIHPDLDVYLMRLLALLKR